MDHHDHDHMAAGGHEGHGGHGDHDHAAMMAAQANQPTMSPRQHEHHHGGDGDEGGMECSMQMIFHGGNCEYILFDSWVVTQAGAFVGVAILIFLAAVAYEGLKYLREKMYYDAHKLEQLAQDKDGSQQNLRTSQKPLRQQILNKEHLIQTVLHMFQVAASYLLMLIVMTYNVWLFVAVVLGATTGYFLFGWIRNKAVDITEHCH